MIIIIETVPALRRRILLPNPPQLLLGCFWIATTTNTATGQDEIEEIEEENDKGGREAISSLNAPQLQRRQVW